MLTWAAFSDGVLIAFTTVALAAQGLMPFLPGLAIARARGARANIHGIRVSGVLLKQGGLVGA